MKKIGTTIAAAAALTAGLMVAATPAIASDAAIKGRKGYFQAVAFQMGGLAAIAKGEVEYEASSAQRLADSLAALSQVDVGLMFVDGTDNETLPGQTRALDMIWNNTTGFAARGLEFREAAQELAANAGDGLGALRGGIGKVGGTCKACHDEFRAK